MSRVETQGHWYSPCLSSSLFWSVVKVVFQCGSVRMHSHCLLLLCCSNFIRFLDFLHFSFIGLIKFAGNDHQKAVQSYRGSCRFEERGSSFNCDALFYYKLVFEIQNTRTTGVFWSLRVFVRLWNILELDSPPPPLLPISEALERAVKRKEKNEWHDRMVRYCKWFYWEGSIAR